MTLNAAQLKRQAAAAAVDFIESGMVVGLGAGSTALQAIIQLGERLKAGELREIVGVPCSKQVAEDAERYGVPLTSLEDHPVIDLTIDGADEVDAQLRVIKGGGGALLREKIVAQASRREIIIVDPSKLSSMLGTLWAVPVEVIPFGARSQREFLERLGATVVKRKTKDGAIFYTDQGNLILDANFGPIPNVEALARALNDRAGIVEHGLFLGLVTDLIVAAPEGVSHQKLEG
ncbi:MAG: ribose-5-phosphate isomerase RpiA [Caldilineaceae bacterium]|nr:ribose-5-phosphate isomerase RpiA [Caldilineaceae bacterium]